MFAAREHGPQCVRVVWTEHPRGQAVNTDMMPRGWEGNRGVYVRLLNYHCIACDVACGDSECRVLVVLVSVYGQLPAVHTT